MTGLLFLAASIVGTLAAIARYIVRTRQVRRGDYG